MADFPLGGCQKSFSGGIGSVSAGVVVTASASANTKGSWAELDASTETGVSSLRFTFSPTTITANTQGLIDIGIGGAGSEVVVVENIEVVTDSAIDRQAIYAFNVPLSVGDGVRVAARWQTSSTNADTISCMMAFDSPNFKTHPGYGAVVTYGATTATSKGTTVDPGATANTLGAWTEFADPTDGFSGFFLSMGGDSSTTQQDSNFLLQVGIGGSGSEEVIVPAISYRTSGGETNFAYTAYIDHAIPEGERLAIRAQSSGTGATARAISVCFHGVK